MKIDEALEILKILIIDNTRDIYDFEDRAIVVLLTEYENLKKEVARLAIESVEREKEVARLEGDILAWKLYHTKG